MKIIKDFIIDYKSFKFSFVLKLSLFIFLFFSVNYFYFFLISEILLIGISKIIHNFILLLSSVSTFFIAVKLIDKKNFSEYGIIFTNRSINFTIFTIGFGLPFIISALFFAINIIFNLTEIQFIRFDINQLLAEAAIFLMLSISEELIFRGYINFNIYHSIKDKKINEDLKIALSSIASGFIFSLAHFFNPDFSLISFANIFLAGVFLGMWTLKIKSLSFCISFHFSWNFFQGSIFGFPVSGYFCDFSLIKINLKKTSLALNGGYFGIEGSLLLIMFFVFFIILTNNFLIQKFKVESK